jgi:esterase/lipase
MLRRNTEVPMERRLHSKPAVDPIAPSLLLMGIEPLRAAVDYAAMKLMDRQALPRGDGHAVVIFPGLASDRRATAPLRRFLDDLGYDVHDWGRGFNTGPDADVDPWLETLALDIDHLTRQRSEHVSLIGWSLGGIYAREVGKRLPQRVRQVITLGTPFAGTPQSSNVGWVYRLLNGQSPPVDEALRARLKAVPAVPTTSIFSRSDGIVAWESCVQEGDHAHSENIEVKGSHCGLGWNPAALAIIAERLSQPHGQWQRYRAIQSDCS